MEQRLPKYIVECFKVSGFDDIDAIHEMNVTTQPNSINVIEKYIDKHKAQFPQCMGPTTSSMPFEFPPEHHIRIRKVLKELQDQYGISPGNTLSKQCRSSVNKQKASAAANPNKRYKSNDDEEVDTITTVKADISKRIASYCAKSNDERFSHLKEGEHYSIEVSRCTSNSKAFSVCQMLLWEGHNATENTQ